MITKTYMIPEENVENLEKKFNAAARKIRKINPELEPTMTKSNHTIVLVRKIELHPYDCRSETTVKEVPYEARRMELKIPDEAVFAENNWAFGGSVEPSGVDGKNFVNVNLSGGDLGFIVPKKYFSSSPCSCDYCKTNRRRNKTYLVVNQEAGEWKQLGKECLKLFVTGIDVDAIATFESFIKEAEDAVDPGDEFFYNRRFKFVNVSDALRMAIALYNKSGYVATKDLCGNTADLSNKNIVQRKLLQKYGSEDDLLPISAKVRDAINGIVIDCNAVTDSEYDDAVKYVLSLPDDPFYNNLKTIASNEFIPLRKLGYLVSIPKIIQSYKDSEKKEEVARASEYLGNIGDKITFSFVSSREAACIVTQYGTMHIYEFEDKDNNIVVWKSSVSKNIPDRGTVCGTVKSHEEYNGTKQTVILRAKIS